MISVSALADVHQRLASVDRTERTGVEHVHSVFRDRIGGDVRVIEGALADVAVVVDQLPRRSRIVGTEESAFLVLDEGVDPVRVRARDSDADAADHALGKPGIAGDLCPCVAAVRRLEQSAARTAARHLVFDPERFPQRGEHHVRCLAVDRNIDRPGLIVPEERLLPGLAAVCALENAAFVARRSVLAEGGDVNDVRVGGVDADLRYGL